MNHLTTPRSLTLIAAAALAVAAALPRAAHAQDYGAMLQRELAKSAQLSQTMQQTQNSMVQQAMQNPQIQAGYQQYLAQTQQRGGQPMDFPTYAYYYMYTNGFSSAGIAHMNNVENGNRAGEMNAWRGVQQAEQNRGQAMQAQRNGYFANQQEAGRALMGQSTYYGQNGFQSQLPHTWQNNTYQTYQGNNYYVDQSGRYYRIDANGYAYPIGR
ncbi:MAG: hypothetical protein ABI887_02900 [Burkholderiales bacterium]